MTETEFLTRALKSSQPESNSEAPIIAVSMQRGTAIFFMSVIPSRVGRPFMAPKRQRDVRTLR